MRPGILGVGGFPPGAVECLREAPHSIQKGVECWVCDRSELAVECNHESTVHPCLEKEWASTATALARGRVALGLGCKMPYLLQKRCICCSTSIRAISAASVRASYSSACTRIWSWGKVEHRGDIRSRKREDQERGGERKIMRGGESKIKEGRGR